MFFSIIVLLSTIFSPLSANYVDFAQNHLSLDFPEAPSLERAAIDDYLLIGPDADTFYVDTNFVWDGTVYIYGDGVLIVDSAYFSVAGQLAIAGNGAAIFKNHATLHFDQFFVGQYSLWLFDNGYFEATDATIDANGTMHFVELHDNGVYIVRRTYFPNWTFRRIYEHSTLVLEDIGHVGDLLVDDSCSIHFIRCDTLMPWLQTPDGSVVDIEFPNIDSVEHFEFSEDTPGVDGIGYTVTVDSCRQCWWSLETFPGCSVIVRDSEIHGSCIRIPGSDTISVSGIFNYEYHTDMIIPLSDRHLEYENTYVWWWNWYPLESTVFYIDSCFFGEMIGKNSSTTFATRCIHDGATITLSVLDSAFMTFEAGSSLGYVCSFQQSTMLLINTRIRPTWPYQATNIAHHNSKMLCVNCDFDSLPFALDTALVMWVDIDSIDNQGGFSYILPKIWGSVWLDAGPERTTIFDRYKLYWKFSDDTLWTMLRESTEEIHCGIIDSLHDMPLYETDYDFRLTMWNSDGESLSATTEWSGPGAIAEKSYRPDNLSIEAYPNPFNSSVCITLSYHSAANEGRNTETQYTTPSGFPIELGMTQQFSCYAWAGGDPAGKVDVRIYDLRGNVVGKFDLSDSKERLQRDAKHRWSSGTLVWIPDKSVASGIYLVRAMTEDRQTITKRIVYLR